MSHVSQAINLTQHYLRRGTDEALDVEPFSQVGVLGDEVDRVERNLDLVGAVRAEAQEDAGH